MPVEIIPIREEHIESFRAALDVVAREKIYLALAEAPPLESTRAFVRQNIAAGHPQFVAVTDGDVVGWCDAIPMARPSRRHCGLLGMGLLPKWRGKGLGERLLRQTLDAARSYGLSRVELSARADNTRAEKLYRKLGFEVEGRNRRALLVDGQFHDLILMAVLFDAGRPSSGTSAERPG